MPIINVELFHIFIETVIFFFQESLINRKFKRTLYLQENSFVTSSFEK